MGKAGDSVGTVAQKAKTPALIGTVAAAGLAGGMAVGSRFLSRSKGTGMAARGRSALIPSRSGGAVKSVVHEVQQVGKEIGKAGFRVGVGDVSMEVKKGRREKRDSPLEVLLKGLTSRHTERA